MEIPSLENFTPSVSDLMKNDYLNEYLSFFSLLPNIKDKYKNVIAPDGFSQRFPNTTYNKVSFFVSEAEKQKIEVLDKLAEEASSLVSESEKNIKALLEIAIKASMLCGRPEWAEKFKTGL